MLVLKVERIELFDESREEFVTIPERTIELEHSLASLSKWESKWEIPFLSDKEKTDEQTLDYVRCMTITPDVSPHTYDALTPEQYSQIGAYINAKQTATWFSDKQQKRPNREVITSELIYYWMVSLTIPFECQEWHLNRLLTLVRVCNEKNNPNKKKMSRSEIAARNQELNAQRRAQLKTEG